MRELNPTLYEQIEEWYEQLSPEVNVLALGDKEDNLHNSKEAIIACLVEQFPVSYRQCYEIYADLFQNVEIFQAYNQLSVIQVLALGTGSGGDVFGMIHAIEEFFSDKVVNIFTVEGNKLALRSQMNMFRHYMSLGIIKNEINLIPISTVVQPSFKGFKEKLTQLCFQPYDFNKFDLIQSVNWMNELSVRKQVNFVELYSFIQGGLQSNRMVIIAEKINPYSNSEDKSISSRALDGFKLFCARQKKSKQPLYALTPTPCIARRLGRKSDSSCKDCNMCFDEIKCYIKRGDEYRFSWQSTYLFVMKLASSSLGVHLAQNLQDETIGYRTMSEVSNYARRYCTLNQKVEPQVLGNAFKLCQNQKD